MTNEAKRKTLMFFLLAVIVTILIAAALPQLDLKSGIPLPDYKDTNAAQPAEINPFAAISLSTLMKTILAFVVVCVCLYGGYKALRGAPWKEIIGPALFIAFTAGVVLVIFFVLGRVRVNLAPQAVEILPPALKVSGPPFGPLPDGLLWVVWITLFVLLVFLAVWIIRWRRRPISAGDALRLEAERAIQALRSGGDFKNVIIRCYQQMSEVLKQEQGLELDETMTAREFERLLGARGIPQVPVHQLTMLFEAARYSQRPPATGDEQLAIDCLHAIVQFSQEVQPA
jgi:hypothetical protein